MKKYFIVKSPDRVDIYKEGVFSLSFPRLEGNPIPDDIVESATVFDTEKGFFNTDDAVLVESSDALIVAGRNSASVVSLPFRKLFAAGMKRACQEIEKLQRQAGFFAMTENQRESLESFLYSCLSELTFVPPVLSIPVFGYFNYAKTDEAVVDESDVLKNTEYRGEELFPLLIDAALPIARPFFDSGLPEKRYLRSVIVKSLIDRIEL